MPKPYSKAEQLKRKEKPRCNWGGCKTPRKPGSNFCGLHTKTLKGQPKSRKPRKPIAKKEKGKWQQAFDEAKKQFQRLRRIEEADENGIVTTVDGSRVKWNACDGGHYFEATKKGTCFDKLNVWPQRKMNNKNMGSPSVLLEYRQFLLTTLGKEEFERMEIRSHVSVKYSVFELGIMAKEFKTEADRIKLEKGF